MAKDQLGRLIWLADTIYRAKRITYKEIRDKWELHTNGDKYPQRTFFYHILALNDNFDIDIECDRTTNEYYIEDADNAIGNGIKPWLLNSFSVNNLMSKNKDLKDRIVFEKVSAGIEYITPIVEAMRDSVQIGITYQSYEWDEAQIIKVNPYFLRLFKQRWYLIGQNAKTKKLRLYSLDRTYKVVVSNEKFKYPKKINPENLYKNAYGIIFEDDAEPKKVVLKVEASQAYYVRGLPLHASQKETKHTDQYSIFEMTVVPTYDFFKEILSFGSAIEVLEPKSLRENIRKEVKDMMRYYKEKPTSKNKEL